MDTKLLHEAMQDISKNFGIKTVFGLLVRDSNIVYATKCILCGAESEVLRESFLGDAMTHHRSCTSCGATVTYNSLPAHTQEAEEKKPELVVESATQGNFDPHAVAYEFSETSIPDPTSIKDMDARRKLYESHVGDVINGKKLTSLYLKPKGTTKTFMYRLQCTACGRENVASANSVLTHPESVAPCRCYFGRHGTNVPKPGDVIGSYRCLDVHPWEAPGAKNQLRVEVECIKCGKRRALFVGEFMNAKVTCTHTMRGMNAQTIHNISQPEKTVETVTPAGNPKFPTPVTYTVDGVDYLNASANGHLFMIYRGMVRRAKRFNLPISLEWYDDTVPLVQNVDGYTRFFMWSLRNGYINVKSNPSERNIAQLLRRDSAYGYGPENCEWRLVGDTKRRV